MKDKINKSIKLLQEYEEAANKFGGYTLCFSGGKDSQVIYDLAKKSGVNFKAVYNVTTLDMPENVRFIRKNYKDVQFILPKENFFKLIERKKMLPTMCRRFCCSDLKEYYGVGYIITGVRREESTKRSKYNEIEVETKNKKKTHVRPILEWTEMEVWQYIEDNNISINPCYELENRVGCMFCPFASTRNIHYMAERYPKYYRLFLKAIKQIMDKGYLREFASLNINEVDVFNWWASKENAKKYFTQLNLF